jgi:hypothetical protein
VIPDDASEPERLAGEALGRWARVYFDDLEIRVRWDTALEYVHCIGELARWGDADALRTDAELLEGARPVVSHVARQNLVVPGALSGAERASVYSTASERARLLARRLMARWEQHLQDAEVVRLWRSRGWSAPMIFRAGRPVIGFDVSLSHDGRFVAAAVTGPAA